MLCCSESFFRIPKILKKTRFWMKWMMTTVFYQRGAPPRPCGVKLVIEGKSYRVDNFMKRSKRTAQSAEKEK